MKKELSNLVRLATAIGISTMLGACGGSAKSPLAPSSGTPAAPVPVPPAGVSTGATIGGTVVGVAGGQAIAFRAMGVGASVSVMGTSITSQIDNSGHFELRGVPSGDVQLQVSTGSANAVLTLSGVADHEQIRITIQVNGSTASTDDVDRETNDSRVEVEGRITAVNGTTLTVAGRNVSVPNGTPVHHGSTSIQLSSLRAGDRVHIHGVNSGGGVAATDVDVENGGTPDPGDDHGNDQGEREISGTVTARGGSCPSITFTVGTTKISTDANTRFSDTTCGSVANGDSVKVEGTMQSNGTLIARSVEKSGGGDDHGNDSGQAELNGNVTGRGGSCPAITFSVGGTSVATDSKTSFRDTSCSALANGDRVQVKGTKQGSGTVLAATVEKK